MKDINYKDLNIVFEDNHIIVVVKPYNVPSQEDSSGDKDMLTLLKEYLVETYTKPGNAFLGLVHRLDRPTGGVMVFAKTSKAAARLTESIQAGELEKKYLAVVKGKTRRNSEKLDDYLYKYENLNLVKVVPMTTAGAKRAVLVYKLLEEKEDNSLITVNLLTGRSHQIRVQMEFIGNPLLGDVKYNKTPDPKCNNLALWATELRFPHPTTRDIMVFRLYPDLEEYPWNQFDLDRHLRITINN
ncbi:MAG: RluA family pseudouridine synthase [Clostridia bacterium]|nr:RluA family pseudouridine synthase [Clostridia bacterium]